MTSQGKSIPSAMKTTAVNGGGGGGDLHGPTALMRRPPEPMVSGQIAKAASTSVAQGC